MLEPGSTLSVGEIVSSDLSRACMQTPAATLVADRVWTALRERGGSWRGAYHVRPDTCNCQGAKAVEGPCGAKCA